MNIGSYEFIQIVGPLVVFLSDVTSLSISTKLCFHTTLNNSVRPLPLRWLLIVTLLRRGVSPYPPYVPLSLHSLGSLTSSVRPRFDTTPMVYPRTWFLPPWDTFPKLWLKSPLPSVTVSSTDLDSFSPLYEPKKGEGWKVKKWSRWVAGSDGSSVD